MLESRGVPWATRRPIYSAMLNREKMFNKKIYNNDYLTMAILRVFSLHTDYGLAANEDVDQFYPFWRSVNCFEDDFIFKQKMGETSRDSELFLQ